MTTIKLHYDGWLALPASLRRQLSIGTGDQLELEVLDGAIVLRPVGSKPAAVSAHTPTVPDLAPRRGRPRKAVAEPAAPLLRVGGRRAAKLPAG